ncbi:hypothetical protein YC2023_005303 [Brassica napus]
MQTEKEEDRRKNRREKGEDRKRDGIYFPFVFKEYPMGDGHIREEAKQTRIDSVFYKYERKVGVRDSLAIAMDVHNITKTRSISDSSTAFRLRHRWPLQTQPLKIKIRVYVSFTRLSLRHIIRASSDGGDDDIPPPSLSWLGTLSPSNVCEGGKQKFFLCSSLMSV